MTAEFPDSCSPVAKLLRPEKPGVVDLLIFWPAGGGWPRTLVLEGIEAIVFRTIGDRPSL
jgi:hypothetical protein